MAASGKPPKPVGLTSLDGEVPSQKIHSRTPRIPMKVTVFALAIWLLTTVSGAQTGCQLASSLF